jgi:hypothetical protein
VAVSSRRHFLAQLLGVTALGGAASASGLGRVPPLPRRVLVYRLSTHRRRTCGACKAHGANRFYQTWAAADAGRAHPGCNCSIVTQPLPRGLVAHLFRHCDVFDRRIRRRPKKKLPQAKKKEGPKRER